MGRPRVTHFLEDPFIQGIAAIGTALFILSRVGWGGPIIDAVCVLGAGAWVVIGASWFRRRP